MKIFINGIQVVCSNNFTITEEMLNTSSTILNNVYPIEWEEDKDFVSRFYFPPIYSRCVIYDENDNLIFSGVAKNSGNISINPRQPHWINLQILGNETFLSEGQTLDFVITEKTLVEAMQMVIDEIASYGFVLGNVNVLNPDEIIGTYSTLNKTPYDLFCYFADISQSRWMTRVIDEKTTAIDFYDPSLMPEGTELIASKEYTKTNDIDDITFSYGSYDYRNKQIIQSDNTLGDIPRQEGKLANGIDYTFITEENIGILTQVNINGRTDYTIASDIEQSLGVIADFYYKVGQNQIVSDRKLAVDTYVIFTYTPIIYGRQVVINDGEVNRITASLQTNGTISRYEQRNDSTSSEELNRIAQTYIKYKGVPEVILTVKTRTPIWNIGEVVEFTAPLEELSTKYMVKSKATNYIVTADAIFYTYTMASSFNVEKDINYFDNQRYKNGGNIKPGEFIVRNIDVSNTANIIYSDLVIEETEMTNALNSTLNTPL